MSAQRLKWLVTLGAISLAAVHMISPGLRIDEITLALLIMAMVPWLAAFLHDLELPGGWKVKFREIKEEHEQTRQDVDRLKFVISHFVTDDELKHLQTLADGRPFPFRRDETWAFFSAELRRLRALGLIAGHPNRGVRSLEAQGGDVNDHFQITARGQEYLHLRADADRAAQEQQGSD